MIRLHGYWRSSAAYRVRIALNLKGIEYSQATYDLRSQAHRTPGFLGLSPQGLVPALDRDGSVLSQSLAILEWLDETHPAPPLLPGDAEGRAQVRAMACLVACDIHPLNNLRVIQQLRTRFGTDNDAVKAWAALWIEAGFAALEQLIARHGGRHAFGDCMTLADCCIVPQVYSAERFRVPLDGFPNILRITEAARALDPVARAHPENQPDADAPLQRDAGQPTAG